MKLSILLKLLRFWPPFLGAGISVKDFNSDLSEIIVQMKMRFWNKNYVGTHFGGSLYSMTDPFYMLMLLKLLGDEYIVWDKSASIRYKIPVKGTVYAKFQIAHDVVKKIQQEVNQQGKSESEFIILLTDSEGNIVAEVKKMIYVALKSHSKNKKID